MSEFLRSAVTNARKGIPAINDALRDETHRMTNSTNFAVALALILATIMTVAAGGNKYHSPADAGALPFPAKPGNETPFLATKGDRLHVRPDIREIAGATVVLRDFDQIVR